MSFGKLVDGATTINVNNTYLKFLTHPDFSTDPYPLHFQLIKLPLAIPMCPISNSRWLFKYNNSASQLMALLSHH
jgi:hypothetical protein